MRSERRTYISWYERRTSTHMQKTTCTHVQLHRYRKHILVWWGLHLFVIFVFISTHTQLTRPAVTESEAKSKPKSCLTKTRKENCGRPCRATARPAEVQEPVSPSLLHTASILRRRQQPPVASTCPRPGIPCQQAALRCYW